MGVFDFIAQNAERLSSLEIDEDGNIMVEPGEFDFSHPDLEVEYIEPFLLFKVSVSPFQLITEVYGQDLKDVSSKLKAIGRPEKRKVVISAIENDLLEIVQDGVTNAREQLDLSKQELQEAEKSYNGLVSGVRDLKSAWNLI